MSTASDQYFLSYVKKTTGGGLNCPPPSRNRVKSSFKMMRVTGIRNVVFIPTAKKDAHCAIKHI